MGITERLAAPSRDDLASLQQLVVESRWNQSPEDWDVFLRLGTVHVVRDEAGRIVASGAVLPMGASPVAWISMILVMPARRGVGLGRAVFGACLRQIQFEGRIPMLDATPAGEALYTQFGFRPQWRLARWRREASERDARNAGLSRSLQRQPAGEALQGLVKLDAAALGFDRRTLLEQLADRRGSVCVAGGEAAGLVREGRTARHVGPLLARSEAAAGPLLRDIVDAEDAALLIDLRDARPLLRATLEAAGFRHERPFARMALLAPGQVLPAGDDALLHAVAGPEYA
ncbi:GNAT family N-acetyltransferase [Ramlibacter alkalitolerans]|uniref:GNAT family N-acetyltransferase n=1 Tax=Ramlibacter alkalitolerans TaxID=2039631 RepID=A0ABS1JQC4_9BURK|nr:GNAT family N-acetyltransferase [Ramlibacter alkalitolerans]MBL0425760.1 GNAT family N-acetyltransferase [Ramlibacter alkalitolerans]